MNYILGIVWNGLVEYGIVRLGLVRNILIFGKFWSGWLLRSSVRVWLGKDINYIYGRVNYGTVWLAGVR